MALYSLKDQGFYEPFDRIAEKRARDKAEKLAEEAIAEEKRRFETEQELKERKLALDEELGLGGLELTKRGQDLGVKRTEINQQGATDRAELSANTSLAVSDASISSREKLAEAAAASDQALAKRKADEAIEEAKRLRALRAEFIRNAEIISRYERGEDVPDDAVLKAAARQSVISPQIDATPVERPSAPADVVSKTATEAGLEPSGITPQGGLEYKRPYRKAAGTASAEPELTPEQLAAQALGGSVSSTAAAKPKERDLSSLPQFDAAYQWAAAGYPEAVVAGKYTPQGGN